MEPLGITTGVASLVAVCARAISACRDIVSRFQDTPSYIYEVLGHPTVALLTNAFNAVTFAACNLEVLCLEAGQAAPARTSCPL